MKSKFFPAQLMLPNYYYSKEGETVKQIYLTAILPTTTSDAWKLNPIHWLDPRAKGTPAYYPNLLISYYHWRTTRFQFVDPEREHLIFGDSGGYSVVTLGARIDPVEVVRWQILNCHVGCILDVPPFVDVGGASAKTARPTDWSTALRITLQNVERAKDALGGYLEALQKGSPFRWWGVVHGRSPSEMREWYERVSEIYPFTREGEGWAFKPHPTKDPRAVALSLKFIQTLGVTRAHFLMMTGLPALTTMFCLGKLAGIKHSSYDSAASSFSGINRVVFVLDPDGLGYWGLGEVSRNGETQARDFLLSCGCQSCKWLRDDLEEHPEKINSEYWKYRMIYHNTLTAIRTYEALSRAAEEDPVRLLREKLGNRYGKVMHAFEARSLTDW